MAIRKLSIFRLLQGVGKEPTHTSSSGDANVVVVGSAVNPATKDDDENGGGSSSGRQQKKNSSTPQQKPPKRQRKGQGKGGSKGSQSIKSLQDVPLEIQLQLMPPSFIFEAFLPSWDSLGPSVGYTVHLDMEQSSSSQPKQLVKENLVPYFEQMMYNYIDHINDDTTAGGNQKLWQHPFWKGLWDWERVIGKMSPKTVIFLYQAMGKCLVSKLEMDGRTKENGSVALSNRRLVIPMDNDDIRSLRTTITDLFRVNQMVLSNRRKILTILSRMLSLAAPHVTSDRNVSTEKHINSQWNPVDVLQLLSLYSRDYFSLDKPDWSLDHEESLQSLAVWIRNWDVGQLMTSKQSAAMVGATFASAFVTGQLTPASTTSSQSEESNTWDPMERCSGKEESVGWSVVLFSSLCGIGVTKVNSGELLWPAVHKGMSNTASIILSGNPAKAGSVSRALLLLENGCKLRQLSGLGNGDLVLDPKTQQLFPPPPNVEKILHDSVDFIQWQIRNIMAVEKKSDVNDADADTRPSLSVRTISVAFFRLVGQLSTLKQAYPSSVTLDTALDELLRSSFLALSKPSDGNNKVLLVGLIYATLNSGADLREESYANCCHLLLTTKLNEDTGIESLPKDLWGKATRSLFLSSKWAAISRVLTLWFTSSDQSHSVPTEEARNMINKVLQEGLNAVRLCPVSALVPLFDCIVTASRQWICHAGMDTSEAERLYLDRLQEIIGALLHLMKENSISAQSAYMLNEICALIFQPKLLQAEYEHLQANPACRTPIRDAFRRLMELAGTVRPHVSRAVLCRIIVAWAAADSSNNEPSKGLNAIPYRDDIVNLLLLKEILQEESSTNQSREVLPNDDGVMEIPAHTMESSITRTFILLFLSQLPDPHMGLSPKVLTDLLQYVILRLLNRVNSDAGSHPSAVMKGTPTYCMKMRGWQALCILSRFVTEPIAPTVCEGIFQSLREPTHNQIRYFTEVTAIKCGTLHPDIFGRSYLTNISHTDLALQHICSLMVLGGNWIVGKYRLEFFAAPDNMDKDRKDRLSHVVAAIIPWLSCSQGFSRAIAQVLVYALIPRTIDVSHLDATTVIDPTEEGRDEHWFPKVMYRFLDQNPEMKRVRNKQLKFFDGYDVDDVCTLEGILKIPVDENVEANPIHLIDSMKEALRQVYEEAHGPDAPAWKQEEEWKSLIQAGSTLDEANSTFQRKIIPVDSLNLALEDLRERRMSNAAGMHRQPLIVCATLIDKVPNLGGLTRTCEIFAAESLVIPDMAVTKLDLFKGLSASAAEWIDIQEVNEEVRI